MCCAPKWMFTQYIVLTKHYFSSVWEQVKISNSATHRSTASFSLCHPVVGAPKFHLYLRCTSHRPFAHKRRSSVFWRSSPLFQRLSLSTIRQAERCSMTMFDTTRATELSKDVEKEQTAIDSDPTVAGTSDRRGFIVDSIGDSIISYIGTMYVPVICRVSHMMKKILLVGQSVIGSC